MVKFIFCFAFLLATSAALCDDSQIIGPSFADIEGEMNTLEMQYPGLAEKVNYGISQSGTHPLLMMKIANKKVPVGQHAFLLIGAIHGDEYLGFEHRFARWFLEESQTSVLLKAFLDAGHAIYIIPVFNPDGYAIRTRESANGADLNRDFPIQGIGHKGLTQPETIQYVTYMKKESRKIVASVDYHCCGGAFGYPWSYDNAPQMTERDAIIYKRYFSSWLDSVQFYNVDGILHAKTVFSTPFLLGYTANGLHTDYIHEQFGSLNLIYEGGAYFESYNFISHQILWKKIIKWHNLLPIFPL